MPGRIAIAAALALSAGGASAATLELTEIIAPGAIVEPIHAAAPPGDETRLFVLSRRTGRIDIYDRTTGQLAPTPFFEGPGDVGGVREQGAYAIAFDPDFATNGRVFLSYANTAGDHLVVQVVDTGGARPEVATVLTVEHPDDNLQGHFGGWIGVDVAGNLFVTTGDSDEIPPPPATVDAESQDLSNLLGAVLRITPNAVGEAPGYTIPEGNLDPSQGRPEIWAHGLRNPFRAGYDAETGALLIGDVGENRAEEINLGIPGANYGWPAREGFLPFPPELVAGMPDFDGPFEDPLFQYLHAPGQLQSVAGGEVYRGPVAGLEGLYFFADIVTTQVYSLEFDPDAPSLTDLTEWVLDFDTGGIGVLVSFAKDASDNLYALDQFGGVYQVTGARDVVRAAEIPLPAAIWLMGAGLALGLAAARRRG